MTSMKDSSMVLEEFGLGQLQPSPPLRERVYDALERLMVDRILPPGIHLVEDDLASRLGVSRNPIREALQRLEQEGFVDRQPGRGAFVHSPSVDEVDEVFYVRSLLESESARLAAERISPAQLAELEQILEQGQSAVKAKDVGQLLELNERFHDHVIAAAGNSVMAKMMITLRQRIRWYFSAVVVTRAPESWNQHAEIFAALRDRDGARAASGMAAHVAQTQRTIQSQRTVQPQPSATPQQL